jgi:hypothetical protein
MRPGDKQIQGQLKQQQDLSDPHFSHEVDELHTRTHGKVVRQFFGFDRTLCRQLLHGRFVPIWITFSVIAFGERGSWDQAGLLESTLFSLVVELVGQ